MNKDHVEKHDPIQTVEKIEVVREEPAVGWAAQTATPLDASEPPNESESDNIDVQEQRDSDSTSSIHDEPKREKEIRELDANRKFLNVRLSSPTCCFGLMYLQDYKQFATKNKIPKWMNKKMRKPGALPHFIRNWLAGYLPAVNVDYRLDCAEDTPIEILGPDKGRQKQEVSLAYALQLVRPKSLSLVRLGLTFPISVLLLQLYYYRLIRKRHCGA